MKRRVILKKSSSVILLLKQRNLKTDFTLLAYTFHILGVEGEVFIFISQSADC